jgi:aerobic carbon-monoxide dehydrogenase medium subunit
MIAFEYDEPTTIDEALQILAQHGDDARVIAGGTALINLMKQRLVQPAHVVGLRQIPGLNVINRNGDLHIGALATHRAVETSRVVESHAPVLQEMLHTVASIRIRNIATIGGSLAHADPNQDIPPVLMILDARVQTRSPGGQRDLPIDGFFSGYYETILEPGEVVTGVTIPAQPAGSGAAFLKFLPQTQDDYATVSAAARLTLAGGRITDARVAAGSSAPTPLRLVGVEAALTGQAPDAATLRDAAALASQAVNPTSDFRGSAAYKRDMAAVFVRRALEQAVARAQGG